MTWIKINETQTRTDPDGNEVEVPKGLPTRAPFMDDALEEADEDPDEYLPIEYTDNRKANLPGALADAIVTEYDHAEVAGEG